MHRPVQSRTARRPLVAGLAMVLALVACQAGPSAPASTGSASNPGPTPVPTVPSTPAASPTGQVATPAGTSVPLQRLSITAAPFATVRGTPLSMAAPDDGTGRLFVGNQEGEIWVVSRDGRMARNPLVNLDARIASGGERGLLGIAVHPAFPIDPRVFVNYTNNDGDTVVASLALDPENASRLDPASFRRLLFVDQPFANHNGGDLKFGADGYLTIALGDGGAGGDPLGNGQNLDALLGKILRIDVDGSSSTSPYAIPPENPYAAGGGRPEIWLSGMRNPWRTSFDRANGDFWFGDVGQGQWEEVNVVRARTAGPLNFGWNVTEGAHCYGSETCDQAGLIPPVAEYGHDLGCAVIGGYVYRGSAYPFLVGAYLFSDSCSSTIWAIDAASDGPSVPVQVGRVEGSVASFGEDDRGELYVLTRDEAVLKLAATQR